MGISFSFLTYKYFVFKTKNKFFLSEYLKSYIIYGLSFLVGTFFLWLTIEILKLNILISQFITISFTILVSFIGNNNFIFNEK